MSKQNSINSSLKRLVARLTGKNYIDVVDNKNRISKEGEVDQGETANRINPPKKGKHLSEETKNKISVSNKGRRRSTAQKKKISEGRKGIPCSEKQKQVVSEALKGIKRSEETKQKISAANKGRRRSAAQKRRISDGRKGRPCPEELKKKFSDAYKGKPRSPETIRKITETKQANRLSAMQKKKNNKVIKGQDCPTHKKEHKGCMLVVNGIEFSSIAATTRHFGLDYQSFYHSLRTNKDITNYHCSLELDYVTDKRTNYRDKQVIC